MDESFLSVITSRHCKRAFADRQVPRQVLDRVLTAAAHAPSPRNTQFWQVAVLQGAARAELTRLLLAAMEAGAPRQADYDARAEKVAEPYQRRAFAWGAAYYQALGIAREDEAGRREVERRNLGFYGAPVAMIFHLPAGANPGAFLDMGFFLQNVMLGLVSCGLGSCPQFSVARYAKLIREFLGVGDERLVVCSLSVGYVDETDPVNDFVPERAEISEYVSWHSYPPAAVIMPDGPGVAKRLR